MNRIFPCHRSCRFDVPINFTLTFGAGCALNFACFASETFSDVVMEWSVSEYEMARRRSHWKQRSRYVRP